MNVGCSRQSTKSIKVMKPQFTADFPEAVIREGAEELTSRPEGVGSRRTFVDTTHVEAERWGPPVVDADWHACQAIYQGIEGQEPKTMYHYSKDLHHAVGTKKPGENQKARALWSMKAPTDRET